MTNLRSQLTRRPSSGGSCTRSKPATPPVGKLQPILGATEKAVRDAYSSDREHRGAAVDEQIKELLAQVDHLEATGIDLTDEDPLPIPDHPTSPVSWTQLHESLTDLGIELGQAGRPASFGGGASRDPTDWRALATYGYPALADALTAAAIAYDADRSPVLIRSEGTVAAAIRADRSPPEPVHDVGQLWDLGSPVARDDAERLVDEQLRNDAREQRAVYEAVLSDRLIDRQVALRAELVRFFVDLLTTRTAISSLLGGDDVDPAVAWFDLRDEQSQLRYVETFVRQLGVPTTKTFPSLTDINERKKVAITKLQAQRAEHLAAFLDLIAQMQAMRNRTGEN